MTIKNNVINKLAYFLHQSSFAVVAAVFLFTLTLMNGFWFNHASAAQITSRSLSLSSSANGSIAVGTAGTGTNGQKARYTFNFTMPTSGAVGSVLFQFCKTPFPGTLCETPDGLNAATVASKTSVAFTGFSVDTTTNLTGAPWGCSGTTPGRTNCIALTDATPTTVTGAATVSFGGGASDYITNPTTDNQTFYARITTYSDAAYTTAVDTGTVVNSTAQQIDITAKVQETLNFSVGVTPVAPNGNTCTPLSDSGALALGDANGVLSSLQAYSAYSYFRINTNANGGTKVYYSGDTLKSGANSIAAIGTSAAVSDVGASQFGLAIDDTNTVSGSGHSFTSLAATAPYNNGDGTIVEPGGTAQFAFDTASLTTPVEIATTSSVIACDTGSVRYLGNISTTTPPGIYTTSITYLAVPVF
jgi:hypothetical protein